MTLLLHTSSAQGSLAEHLAQAEAQVRQSPGQRDARWGLIELLCMAGQWERVDRHLRSFSQLFEDSERSVTHLSSLLDGERQRADVGAALAMPLPLAAAPTWMDDLAQALHCNARGDPEGADALRLSALERAHCPSGRCRFETAGGPSREQSFEWLADTDSRFGPVLELILQGDYHWLPFESIICLTLRAPQRLCDLVWSPVVLRYRDAQGTDQLIQAHVPARYPGTSDECGEALLLGRLSRWQDVGLSGVFGLGQRCWMSEAAEWPQLDVRQIDFGNRAP